MMMRMRAMVIGLAVVMMVFAVSQERTARDQSPTAGQREGEASRQRGNGASSGQDSAAESRPPTADSKPVMSLLGEELKPVEIPAERRAKLEADLAEAKAVFDADPTDEEAIIWYGRRLAYLGRYREAIDVYFKGFQSHALRMADKPTVEHDEEANRLELARLSRHLGHRYITVREIDRAVRWLGDAANLIEGTDDEVEPDGMPNAAGVPTSTLHTNIYYHLGLALYLQGEFTESRYWYKKCRDASTNDDMRAAASYWLFLNNRRLGDEVAAAAVLESITADMEIIENETYQRLLLLFKGEIAPEDVPGTQESAVGEAVDDATMAYGVAMWHMLNGREDEARKRFERIAGKDRAADAAWAAFGYIAAEAELARGKDSP